MAHTGIRSGRWRGGVPLAACLVFLATAPAPAAAQRLRFRHLTPDDGLSSSWVRAILQDRDGFVWFATNKGLDRYDGYGVRSYTHDAADSTSLASSAIGCLFQDTAGVMWVGTDAGLSRYDADRDRFRNYALDTQGGATALAEAGGVLWVGTSRGLLRFDPATGKATVVPGSLNGRVITILFRDRAGRLWVGTQGAGLLAMVPGSGAVRAYRRNPADPRTLPDDDVRSLAEDASGGIWAGTWNGGLARLDPGTGLVRSYRHDPGNPATLATDRVVTLALDGARGLWVAGENTGLDHLDVASGTFAHYRPDSNDDASLNSGSIWAIHVDPSGALWLGTHTGGANISRRNSDAIRLFRSIAGDPTSLGFNSIRAFAEDGRGAIWVATDGAGLSRLDPATGRFTRISSRNSNLNSDAILGVTVDRSGALWIATWAGGVSRMDAAGRFTAYTSKTSNLPDDNVFSILGDREGRVWVGTRTVGLLLYDGRAGFTRIAYPPPPAQGAWPEGDAAIRQVLELTDGRIAFATTRAGLGILEPATRRLTTFRTRPGDRGSLGSNQVLSFLEAPAGTLWVGTAEGLHRLELASGRLQRFTRADGLPSNYVAGLALDRTGQIWASTDRGIARFRPTREGLGSVQVYAVADGLQGSEFNEYAYGATRDGALLFGGNAGFNLIRPDHMAQDSRKPPVVLTGLQLFNQPVVVGGRGSPLAKAIGRTERLVLSYRQSVLTFEFAALDYTAPEKNLYAYKLEGFDRDWNQIGHKHAATYTNLPAGRYTFRVRAANGDGVWNEAGVALPLVVKPPFWRTWWFRTLMLLAAAAAVGRIVNNARRRREHLERMNAQLAQAAERDRQSQQYLESNVIEILAGMDRFSGGDLSVRLEPGGGDAIGRLRRGFNTAVLNIQNMVLQVQELVHSTAAASEEITASTEELAQRAAEQIEQTRVVTDTTERMSRSAGENAALITEAIQMAERSGEDAQEGTRVVRETLEGMDSIVTIVAAAANAVETLGESGQKIGEITAVIGEIASETELVALNAAIEAAHAGEHGLTFTVVAEEVRKLADRAQIAAREISGVIEQNQQAIGRAVATMGEVGGQVDTGKQLVDRAGAALDAVIANSDRVLRSIRQVTVSSADEARATQTISDIVESISSATRGAAEGNQVIARAIEDLNRLIEDVQERVGHFHVEHATEHQLA